MLATQTTRQAQEVQAAMVIAKRFPRDEFGALQRIQRACQRRGLAETAVYAFPRGGTTVTGPSIRLAECLAQHWGNLDFGVIELEQKEGESVIMAYAWDLETNTRQTKVFTVRHERRVGKGERFRVDRLSDPREVYELVASQGARRVRACILGVVPGDVVESALQACEGTLANDTEPLEQRVRKMVAAFGELGVTAPMVAERLGHKLEVTTEAELAGLRRIYTSLRDGMAKREQFFSLPPARPTFDAAAEEAAEAAAGLAPEPPPPPAPEPPKETPQSRLAALVTGKGFSFDEFRAWGEQSGFLEDAESLGSFDELPAKLAERLLKARKGLLESLTELRKGGRHE